MSIDNLRIRETVDTVATMTELSTRVIKSMVSNDIANSINNNPLTLDALKGLVISRIQYNVSKMTEANV